MGKTDHVLGQKNRSSSLIGYLLVALAAVAWGTGGVYITKLNEVGVPVNLISWVGHAFAIIPMALYVLITLGPKGFKISAKGLAIAAFLGILTKGIFKLAYDRAIVELGASTSVIILYLSPVITVIISAIFLKEKITAKTALALVVNLLGVVLVVSKGDLSSVVNDLSRIGLLLGLIAALLYSINTIVGKSAATDENPITTTFYILLFSASTLTVVAQPWNYGAFFTNSGFLIWGMANALVTGVIGNILFYSGLSKDVKPSTVNVVASMEVVLANIVGVALLGEYTNWIGIIGVGVVVTSIVIMNSSGRKSIGTEQLVAEGELASGEVKQAAAVEGEIPVAVEVEVPVAVEVEVRK